MLVALRLVGAGLEADICPPRPFYSFPRRKASKNDAKRGHCAAVGLKAQEIWGAISYVDAAGERFEAVNSMNRRFEILALSGAARLGSLASGLSRRPGDFTRRIPGDENV